MGQVTLHGILHGKFSVAEDEYTLIVYAAVEISRCAYMLAGLLIQSAGL